MAGEIERMNRIRRNLVLGLFVGTAVAFSGLFIPALREAARPGTEYESSYYFLEWALFTWFAVLLVCAAAFLLYKRRLGKEPGLRAAVNDERVNVNWLRAYRFAFYVVVVLVVARGIISLLLTLVSIRLMAMLPPLSWLILCAAAMSLAGSFLYYNREVRDE